MLLTLTTTAPPATDLGYLLHKSPERAHRFELTFGVWLIARGFASTATVVRSRAST